MDNLGILIPIIAMMIPLTAVAGRYVVQPIVQALGKLAERQPDAQNVAQLAGRLDAQQERLERIEQVLRRLEDAQSFHRELGGDPRGTSLPPG
jgi:hypothetical protein